MILISLNGELLLEYIKFNEYLMNNVLTLDVKLTTKQGRYNCYNDSVFSPC